MEDWEFEMEMRSLDEHVDYHKILFITDKDVHNPHYFYTAGLASFDTMLTRAKHYEELDFEKYNFKPGDAQKLAAILKDTHIKKFKFGGGLKDEDVALILDAMPSTIMRVEIQQKPTRSRYSQESYAIFNPLIFVAQIVLDGVSEFNSADYFSKLNKQALNTIGAKTKAALERLETRHEKGTRSIGFHFFDQKETTTPMLEARNAEHDGIVNSRNRQKD